MTRLMHQLNDMDMHVRHKVEALQAAEAGLPYSSFNHGYGFSQPSFDSTMSLGGSQMTQTLGSQHSEAIASAKAAAAAIPAGPVMPITRPELMPITQGVLYRHEGGGFGKSWRERWVRVEGTDLTFFDKQGATKARDKWQLFASTTFQRSQAKSKNGKYQFELRNEGFPEPLSLYATSEEAVTAWIDTIAHLVDALKEAARQQQANAAAMAQARAALQAAQAAAEAAGVTGAANVSSEVSSMLAGLSGAMSGLQGHLSSAAALNRAVENAAQEYVLPHSLQHLIPQDLDPETLLAVQDEAACQHAYGSGLYEAVKGEPSSFFIQACDAQGTPKPLGGDSFLVTLESEEHADIRWDIVPVDNGDGTYFVEYTPTRVGYYSIRVRFYGQDIAGSPYQLQVSPAPSAPTHAIVQGAGSQEAIPGFVNTFTVISRDAYDEQRGVGGDNLEISVTGPAVVTPIVDNGDGSYTVSYELDITDKELLAAVGRYALWRSGGGEGNAPMTPPVLIRVVMNNPGFAYPRALAGMPLKPLIQLGKASKEVVDAAAALMPTLAKAAEAAKSLASSQKETKAAAAVAAAAAPAPAAAAKGVAPASPPIALPPPPATLPPPVTALPAPLPPPPTAAAPVSAPLQHTYNPEDDPKVQALRAEMAERERLARESLAQERAKLEEERKKFDEERAMMEREVCCTPAPVSVYARKGLVLSIAVSHLSLFLLQKLRMAEITRKMKEGTERLTEQTKALRQAQMLAAQQQAAMAAHQAAPPSAVSPRAQSGAQGVSSSLSPTLPTPIQPDFGATTSAHQTRGEGVSPAAPAFDGAASMLYTSADAGVASSAPQPAGPAAVSVPTSGAASASSGAAPQALLGLEAPAELFEPEVMSLFETHRRALSSVWTYYTAQSGTAGAVEGSGIDAKRFVELYQDYDVCPTFLTKRELRAIFGASSTAHTGGALPEDPTTAPPLSFAAFMEAMGRTALVALSKPAFAHLYPTASAKVSVLLEMWGLADPRKLAEVQRRPAKPSAGPGSIAGKSRASTVDTRATPGRKKKAAVVTL